MGTKPRKKIPEVVVLGRACHCYLGEDALAGESFSRVPHVDIYEADDHYVLNAELPGVAREDIHVEVSGSDLTIRGERRADAICPDENYHRLEGIRGQFRRTFSLPEPLDGANIRASLRDGVLNLVIPKSSKSRNVLIQPSRAGH